MSAIRLLPFPPPYRAALALSNDTDDLLDPRGWWEFLRYLNTAETTRLGPGLDLEIGDAFWFWSDSDAQPGSYFRGLGDTPSPFAPYIARLGRAGYLDTLHSHGNFSRHGGFTRARAEAAGRVLADLEFAPSVWVNHGGAHDFQNLWVGCGDLPENPEAKGAPAPEYHLDLTWGMGFRYAWMGELTLVPGQERGLGPGDWLSPASPVRREAVAHVGRGLARRFGYRHVLRNLPNYDIFGNRLLFPRTLRDGTTVQAFVRCGDFARATLADLPWLLRDGFLNALEAGGGMSVVFLHWSRHPGRSFAGLSPEVADAFQSLARRAREKRLWVTTTGRLLAYAEARNAVRITAAPAGGNTEVRLTAAPLPDGRTLTAADLAGLSFAVPDPARTRIVYSGEALPVQPVPGEPGAVWVPWIPLGFPEPPEAA
jgi:hypothetical protein